MKTTNKGSRLLVAPLCLSLFAATLAGCGGKATGASQTADATDTFVDNDTLQRLDDGTWVVHTDSLAKDVSGFGGAVPLLVYVKDGKVQKVEAQENGESPDFFGRAKALLTWWDGKTVEEAATEQPDAVTGATFSSRAIIENVRRAAAYMAAREKKD